MDIILVSGRSAQVRRLTLRLSHLVMLWAGTVLLAMGASVAVNRLLGGPTSATVSLPVAAAPAIGATDDGWPGARDTGAELQTMARHIAQMQAHLLRLDMLGDRLARIAGFPAQELMFGIQPVGVPQTVAKPAALGELANHVNELVTRLRERRESWGALESLFSLDNLRRKLLPTMFPAEALGYSANFGWRIDPFTHERAFHEGIDIIAEEGTPIVAAAGGLVVYSDFHPQYGNMVEIDHGNSLISRYAHASKRIVQVGDVVAKGAKIGEIGATGRATGPHLHFEVRREGEPRNPAQFLRLRG